MEPDTDQPQAPRYEDEFPSPKAHYHLPLNPAMLRIERGRLARAKRLWCIHLSDRKYEVQSSNGPQYVDLNGEEPCYCEDALLSGAGYVCKHILRVLIEEGHPKVLAHLAQEQELDDQRNEWAHRPNG